MRAKLKLIRKYHLILEKIYVFFLKIKKKNKFIITQEEYDTIHRINNSVYSGAILENVTSQFENIDKIYEECDCISPVQIELYCTDSWYILLALHHDYIEVRDFAAENGKSKNASEVLGGLYNIFYMHRRRLFSALCRDSTSYILIKLLEKGKRIKVLSDEPLFIYDEDFHEVLFKVTFSKKNKKKSLRDVIRHKNGL